jgi:hypothetical protein
MKKFLTLHRRSVKTLDNIVLEFYKKEIFF